MKAHRFSSNSRFLSELDILIMLFGLFEGMKLNLEQNLFQQKKLITTKKWFNFSLITKKTRLDDSFNSVRIWKGVLGKSRRRLKN